MNIGFRICISSPSDSEKLVAEIFWGCEQWTEINQEDGGLEIEIYPKLDGQPWGMPSDQMLSTLSDAKERLLTS